VLKIREVYLNRRISGVAHNKEISSEEWGKYVEPVLV
jgi:hypothetical protein